MLDTKYAFSFRLLLLMLLIEMLPRNCRIFLSTIHSCLDIHMPEVYYKFFGNISRSLHDLKIVSYKISIFLRIAV